MSAHPLPFPSRPERPDVLGELLHSLSQPLTALHCSLELSFDEVAGRQRDAISSALEQTDRVIALIKIMREYLEVERKPLPAQSVALDSAVRALLGPLSVLAEARQIRLRLRGSCTAAIRAPEFRVHRALYYLIAALIESRPENDEIILELHDNLSGSSLTARLRHEFNTSTIGVVSTPAGRDSVAETLRQVRVAIARRIFEAAGVTFQFPEGDRPRFWLRVPAH